MTRYLLYTERQILAYRQKYFNFVKKASQAYISWINSLPLMEWTRIMLPKGQEEAIIGLLCILLIDGQVKILFNNTCTSIRREPTTEEEFEEWLDTAGFKKYDK